MILTSISPSQPLVTGVQLNADFSFLGMGARKPKISRSAGYLAPQFDAPHRLRSCPRREPCRGHACTGAALLRVGHAAAQHDGREQGQHNDAASENCFTNLCHCLFSPSIFESYWLKFPAKLSLPADRSKTALDYRRGRQERLPLPERLSYLNVFECNTNSPTFCLICFLHLCCSNKLQGRFALNADLPKTRGK